MILIRKIKFKPVKRLRFRPDKANVEFVYCYPIEGALFNLRQCEEYQWQRAKHTELIVSQLEAVL